MKTDDAKNWYDTLLELGELLEMFPFLSGNWKDDKKEFKQIHSEVNENLFIVLNDYYEENEEEEV